FDDLLELLARCPIRMVFFGEVRFFSPIKKAAGNFDVGWHEIHLSGFSPEDVQAYLEWRFKQASYRGRLPFTDRQVKEITRLSKGLPGRIDQIADVLLVKLESGDLIVGRSRFPVIHRAVLALLVVVIGVAYLIGQQTPFSWFDEQPDTLALEEPSAANEEPSAANKEPSAAVEEPLAANKEPLAAVEEPSAAAEEPSADNPGADSGKPKTADGSELSGSPENPPGNPGTENPPDRTSREPLPAKPDPPRSIREKPQAESAPTSPGFLYRDARWLMSQPGDTFTLQLFTFSSAERVQAYLADQERPRQFATYRISRDGQILHVVVYGAFATRTQAEAESLRLPASVGEVKPWVRTLAQVQDAIRTALQR
ncbi:MAG: SPOR domain-containing protein, partial [Gammaproteobacteria bacterium]|nr:SPOR domain-containing protein [Gammaproteobacteria bacterium]